MTGPNANLSNIDEDYHSPRDTQSQFRPRLSSSPMSRAGLLGPRSYMSTSSRSSKPPRNALLPHAQDTIRDSTMQISNLPMRTSLSTSMQPSSLSPHAFIFPDGAEAAEGQVIDHLISVSFSSISSRLSEEVADLTASTSTKSPGDATPKALSSFQPSGLSLLMARESSSERTASTATPRVHPVTQTPTLEGINDVELDSGSTPPTAENGQGHPTVDKHAHVPSPGEPAETAPLLGDLEAGQQPSYDSIGATHASNTRKRLKSVFSRFRHQVPGLYVGSELAQKAVQAVPAVLLGTLLNILDGLSYGMIIFPATGLFAELGTGGIGVSMFFVSAIIAQLVYSAGGSGFAGANGSMMIEVVPFFHILATSIAERVGEENVKEVMATTMVAFALSSILTGLSFFLLGALRMGSLIGFFPRHILVGCIGGVGVFLIITGLTVSVGMSDDDFSLSLSTFRNLIFNLHNLVLWLPAFALSVLLRLITLKFHHQLIFPIYFLLIPVIFYVVVAIAHLNLDTLRSGGWVFDIGTSREPWWAFYEYYDFTKVRWETLWDTMPTQFALLFFNILHPPLNVPALAVSLNHDIDTDKELVAHGYSNLLAGAAGTVPNYLVYVNTLLFYRVGGNTRISGFMLAAATIVLLIIGTGPIAYIPVMMVAALIFVLGIDLVKEAVWDSRHRANLWDYITIVSIMICMTVWDFVIGVVFGIVMSCFFFVVQSSQRRSIRALHSGETVMSTVRRPGAHRAYIREVSKLTSILRLQGFLFFGTITNVEETIRKLVDGNSWQCKPIRFLILDISLVAGVDMSAAEAFVRIQRLLSSRKVVLVICGCDVDSPVGMALENVALFQMDGVELFSTFNDALEWTENVYLRSWFASQKTEAVVLPGRQDGLSSFHESVSTSPRQMHLLEAGWRTIARDHSPPNVHNSSQPYSTLVQAFSPYGPIEHDQFQPLLTLLERISIPAGTILWRQNDPPDGLYIVESGVLRAMYSFGEHTLKAEESMVPGTIAGELSALSELPRNATCVVERNAVVWKLSTEGMRKLEREEPELARMFMQMVLKAAKLDYDILLSALATRQ